MKFKNLAHETSVRAALRSNLRYWYNQANDDEIQDGKSWYQRAHQECESTASKFDPVTVAGVVSALSPNNKWQRNLIDARSVLDAVSKNQSADTVKVCTYNANKIKAFEIARGNQEILKKSPKTYAFARNVGALDPDYITVDVWHLRACQSRSNVRKKLTESVTPLQYKVIQEETLKVADQYGLKGYEFQAIVWVTIRNRWANQ